MLGGTAGRFCSPSTSGGPFRIFAVNGFQNRTNDIVYCPPILRQLNQNEEESTAIVYFGGDVQDFPESMETNRDSRGYMKYNLESSAVLLRNAFPRSHIIIIRPVRMEFKTFSCFDNFVRGNNAGVPDHTPMNHALQHLEKLLQNLSVRLKQIPESEILAQAAAAAAVAVAASANAGSPSGSSINNEHASDIMQHQMDIDVLQVQETVTVNADGAMIFPCNETTISLQQQHQQQEQQTTQHTTITNTVTGHTTNLATELMHNNDLQFNNTDCHNLLNSRNPLWWRENLNLDKSKLVLIGFSKGCVVLNQFIYEFHYLKTLTPDDSTMIRLLSRIKDMYWLDGGHGGQKNTWITSRSLLETLTRLGINIHVHVTPYQVQDDRRPWIRKEEKIFSDLLRRLGAPISRHLHFDSSIANLVTHFEVLQAFCQHIHLTNQQHQQAQIQQHQQQQQLRMSGNLVENCSSSVINEEK
ncbi:mitochondrial protein C2orf69 homolog [Condylostylus longicornis]|uniref:mitochondrial protein C2orf69 homolog n=1 Tax=Condylostylus longicornis TaxID=2530218 RepID=UPI00244DCDD4|nr:mitochondrial protein C2orf69 homolog [Condylostylus longicornis]XP_055373769.1 mitochondrial protein C2orf69 homolog [Condylostylus longicornis]